MAKEKKRQAKKYVAGMVAATLIGAAGLWTIQTKYGEMKVPAYEAFRVVDGDTFETNQRQLIRLASVDAPELEYCAGPEAKEALERLVLGRRLYLKVVYRDRSNRLIADVYNDKGSVAAQLAQKGLVLYNQANLKDEKINKAAKEARENNLGIFSSKCVPLTNPENSKCVIKGNRTTRSNDAIYHFPGCGEYTQTLVQLSFGDQWFCTEKEAQAAGFVKGSDCFEKTWEQE